MVELIRKNKRYYIQIMIILLMIMFFLIVSQDMVFATTFKGEEQGRAYDLTKYWNAVQSFYKLIVAISIPCAAVSLAMGAFKLLTSGENQGREAKVQIIATLSAIACILLLPAFVTLGTTIGQQFGWTPKVESTDGLKTTIDDDTKKRHEDDKKIDDQNTDNKNKEGDDKK